MWLTQQKMFSDASVRTLNVFGRFRLHSAIAKGSQELRVLTNNCTEKLQG